MTPFLISFGGITTIAAIIWFIYVFLKEDLIDYIGFNSLRRKIFRRKLKNNNYVNDIGSISSTGRTKPSSNLVGEETVLLTSENNETVLLDTSGGDETTLL